MTKKFRSINTGGHDGWKCVKFCLVFNLSPCARYCLLIGSQLTTWSQGNLHYIGLHFFQLDREFFCLLPSLTRLYSAAASPSERLRSDGSLAIIQTSDSIYGISQFFKTNCTQSMFRTINRGLLAKPFKKFPKSPIRPAGSHF